MSNDPAFADLTYENTFVCRDQAAADRLLLRVAEAGWLAQVQDWSDRRDEAGDTLVTIYTDWADGHSRRCRRLEKLPGVTWSGGGAYVGPLNSLTSSKEA